MRKQWILLIGLIFTLTAFAEENIDPPFSSTDSLKLEVDVKVRAKVSPSSEQTTLMEWLEAAFCSPKAKRVVIDSKQLHQATSDSVETNQSVLIPWEESVILYWETDSLLISASHKGCPGTEVRESVAVSFATESGWSYPPIRYGPLGDNVICPLGGGLELKICSNSNEGPHVQLSSRKTSYSSRQ